ncbi:MAG: ankyrin repeat domain-containing protein [Burkholderiales bacterium]
MRRVLLLIVVAGMALSAHAQSDSAAFELAAAGRLDRLQTELGREPGLATVRNAQGETLLMVASANGHWRVASLLLLKNKADPDAATRDGNTALHRAAAGGHSDAVSLLIALGASTQVKNSAGRTPGEVARAGGHEAVAHALEMAYCAAPMVK